MYQYRMAKFDDLKRIAEVESRAQTESVPSPLEPNEIDREARYNWWVNYFNRTGELQEAEIRRVIFVAMIKLNIVGYIAGHLLSHGDIQGEIQSMQILKPQGGKGVGKNLLEHLAKWFKNQGVSSVCVSVSGQNPYKKFYMQYGATRVNESSFAWVDIGQVASNIEY